MTILEEFTINRASTCYLVSPLSPKKTQESISKELPPNSKIEKAGESQQKTKIYMKAFIPNQFCVIFEFDIADLLLQNDNYLPSLYYFNYKIGDTPSIQFKQFLFGLQNWDISALRKEGVLEVPKENRVIKMKNTSGDFDALGSFFASESFDKKIVATLGVKSNKSKFTFTIRLFTPDSKGNLKYLSKLKIEETVTQTVLNLKNPWKLEIPLEIDGNYLIMLRCQFSQKIYLAIGQNGGKKLIKMEQEITCDMEEGDLKAFVTKDGWIFPEKDRFVRVFLDVPDSVWNTSFILEEEEEEKDGGDENGVAKKSKKCNLI